MNILLNLLYFQSMSSVYIFTFVCVFCFNLKKSDRISVPPDYITFCNICTHQTHQFDKMDLSNICMFLISVVLSNLSRINL